MCENFINQLLFSLSGPELVTVPTGFRTTSIPYKATFLETLSSYYLSTADTCVRIAKWTFIFWLPFVFRTVPSIESLNFYARTFFYFSSAYFVFFVIRGFSRLRNATYRRFIVAFLEAEAKKTDSLIESLTLYGFRHHWPACFDVKDMEKELRLSRVDVPTRVHTSSALLAPIIRILANTVGVRMVYPGCIGFINNLALEPRMKALDVLRIKFNAHRVGLRTIDGDFVEAFYVDGRNNSLTSNGNVLVICCEGNAGFAETGISCAPLSKGFSVLAWNHPGFGSSTALPYPEKEKNAIEAVLLFAIHKLDFPLENIRLFGWSIGGFSVTWASMHLPNIGGIILDATFDNLDELCKNALPLLGESIPVSVIRNHFDLDNEFQIKQYRGPVLIIRRGNDEVISTSSESRRSSNRGNFLLIALLKHRYPHIFNDDSEAILWKYLSLDASGQESYLSTHSITDDLMLPILQREFRKELVSSAVDSDCLEIMSTPTLPFPSNLGRFGISEAMKRSLLLFLTSKYFLEVNGTHCSPLNTDAFKEPWSEVSLLKGADIPIKSNATVEEESNGSSWEKLS